MYRLILSLLLIAVTNVLSAQYLIYPDSIPVQTIRVPLPYLQSGTVQDYITDIQYFPLESKEKADIINLVVDMAIHSDRIMLYSHAIRRNPPTSFIYLYDTLGNLKRRLSTSEDFQSSTVNQIKPQNDGFLINTIHHSIELDTAGHWSKTPNPINDVGDSLLMNKTTWYYQSFRERESGPPTVGLYNNATPIIRYNANEKPTLIEGLSTPLSSYFVDAKAAYSTFPYSTEVFELSDSDIRQVYKFILPLDYTLDTAQYRLVTNEEESKSFSSRYPNAVIGFDNVIRYKNYLLLQLKYLSAKSQWIAFNVETKEFIDLNNLSADGSSDYMPIIGWQKFIQTDGEYLYTILYPNELVDRWAEENNKPITEKARQLSKSKNPVLVRFKLK